MVFVMSLCRAQIVFTLYRPRQVKKSVFEHAQMRRDKSSRSCACAWSHPSLNSPLSTFYIFNEMVLTAESEGPEQTAHPRSLIWAFAVRACSEGTFSPGMAHIYFLAI